MSVGALLLGFLSVCLYCAVVVFIAFVMKWILESVFGWKIEGNVLKWGQIIVILLCLLAIFGWLFGVLPGIGNSQHFLWR